MKTISDRVRTSDFKGSGMAETQHAGSRIGENVRSVVFSCIRATHVDTIESVESVDSTQRAGSVISNTKRKNAKGGGLDER
jgi:predicted ATPase